MLSNREKSRKGNTPTGFYLLWIASTVSIVLISALFIYLGYSSIERGNTNEAIPNFIMGVAGMGIAVKVAYDVAKARMSYQEDRQEISVELSCTSCGRKMLRPFKEGDFVGKLSIEDRCPKCGSPMLMVSIFAKAPKAKVEEKTA